MKTKHTLKNSPWSRHTALSVAFFSTAHNRLGGRPRTPVARAARLLAAARDADFRPGWIVAFQSSKGGSLTSHHWIHSNRRHRVPTIPHLRHFVCLLALWSLLRGLGDSDAPCALPVRFASVWRAALNPGVGAEDCLGKLAEIAWDLVHNQ